MKKIAAGVVIALLALTTPAHASTPVIRIVDVPHTHYDGSFRDNDLASSLLPEGKLGKLVYQTNSEVTWVIDAALIDEVIDMSDGYQFNKEDQAVGALVARAWLGRLRAATIGNPIVALAYGNPDENLLRSIGGKEGALYYSTAQSKLESFFGKPVISQNGWSTGTSHLSYNFKRLYVKNRGLLVGLSKVMRDDRITTLRLRLGRVLNSRLDVKQRAYFSYSAQIAVNKTVNKLRVVSGRYQLTSKNVKVPLTLVNDFDTATVVSLSLIPMNSRVQVQNISEVAIPAHTHIQLSVPFTVVAPGSTLVVAQFMTFNGDLVGKQSKLNLNMTVIDSRVTWFTTAAAIALLLGAVAQSVRRFRKGRHEK
jgi:hypothetical protein